MKKTYILFLTILIIFSSCGMLYFPNKVNVPFISAKHQITVSAATGSSGLELQGAYSPFQNFAILSNVAILNDSTDNAFTSDFALGFYKHLSNKLVYNLFLGSSLGKYSQNFTLLADSTLYFSDSKFFKGYMQTGVSFITNYFSVDFTSKFNLTKLNYQSNYDYQFPSPVIFPEADFTLTFLAGYKFIYLNSQIGYAVVPKILQSSVFPIIFNLGLTLKF